LKFAGAKVKFFSKFKFLILLLPPQKNNKTLLILENKPAPFLLRLALQTAVVLLCAKPCCATITAGAERMDSYLPLLKGKRVAIAANHTSLVGRTHLLDTLRAQGVQVLRVLAPEHGFRGVVEAGATVEGYVDKASGVEVASLYGAGKKPSRKQLRGVQLVLFDMQDVGVRFYTYLSTLHYVMEACAENSIPLVLLDRPNPNIALVDGPILEPQYRSFVGMHAIPIAHGMTLGELAQMLNGEGWLKGGIRCQLTVIPCGGYSRNARYDLPVPPSPNLPNMRSVYLYPSLCLFEGTVMSVARGTDFPFQALGHPRWRNKAFAFTPRSVAGAANNPPHCNQQCYGLDLRVADTAPLLAPAHLDLSYLVEAYRDFSAAGEKFFTPFFVKLAGAPMLQSQVEQGMSAEQIRASWQPMLEKFRQQRSRYLLYD
jgi:uncharacterized protein YbbC (DUF1343 family)